MYYCSVMILSLSCYPAKLVLIVYVLGSRFRCSQLFPIFSCFSLSPKGSAFLPVIQALWFFQLRTSSGKFLQTLYETVFILSFALTLEWSFSQGENSRLFVIAPYLWYVIPCSCDVQCCFWDVFCQLKGCLSVDTVAFSPPASKVFSFSLVSCRSDVKYLYVDKLLLESLMFVYYFSVLLSHNFTNRLMSTDV